MSQQDGSKREAEVPLMWPASFPPRSGWKRFFLGVRWLGPDLSFFGSLRATQARRTSQSLAAWPDEDRRAALLLGSLLKEYVGWETPYFLPEDQFAAIAYGPRFQSLDELLFASFVNALEDTVGAPLPDELWNTPHERLFGDVVAMIRPYVIAPSG